MDDTVYYEDTEYFHDTLNRLGIPTEDEGTRKFLKHLTEIHGTTPDNYLIEKNDDYKYDRLIKSKLPTLEYFNKIEIKNDNRGSDTGNVAIEFGSRGKLSGISKSQAHFWLIKFVYKDRDVFYYINRKRLFDMVFTNPKYFKRTVSPNGNDLALFKYDVFEDEIMEGQFEGDGSIIFINKKNTFIKKNPTII